MFFGLCDFSVIFFFDVLCRSCDFVIILLLLRVHFQNVISHSSKTWKTKITLNQWNAMQIMMTHAICERTMYTSFWTTGNIISNGDCSFIFFYCIISICISIESFSAATGNQYCKLHMQMRPKNLRKKMSLIKITKEVRARGKEMKQNKQIKMCYMIIERWLNQINIYVF